MYCAETQIYSVELFWRRLLVLSGSCVSTEILYMDTVCQKNILSGTFELRLRSEYWVSNKPILSELFGRSLQSGSCMLKKLILSATLWKNKERCNISPWCCTVFYSYSYQRHFSTVLPKSHETLFHTILPPLPQVWVKTKCRDSSLDLWSFM